MKRGVALFALACAAPAHADVAASAPDGFTLRNTVLIAKPPSQVWSALVAWDRWWSPAHSYSGKAPRLDARAGGALAESWPGGSVAHAYVLNAQPDKLLRMQGGFGPLQTLPVVAILSFALVAEGAGTRLTMTYSVAGPTSAKLDGLAPIIDGVMSNGFDRLNRFALTGKPE